MCSHNLSTVKAETESQDQEQHGLCVSKQKNEEREAVVLAENVNPYTTSNLTSEKMCPAVQSKDADIREYNYYMIVHMGIQSCVCDCQ